jgi:spore coat protein U-like protein
VVAFAHHTRRFGRLALASLLLALNAAPALAATATASMSVTATVQATCVITTTTMAFGTYTGLVATSTATLTVTCTNTSPYTVGLSAGAGVSPTATVTTRHMTGPGTGLNYVLTQDAAHATNWGNTPGTDTPASANGTGSGVALTVYGQVAAGQYLTPGSYSDTVTATVNF